MSSSSAGIVSFTMSSFRHASIATMSTGRAVVEWCKISPAGRKTYTPYLLASVHCDCLLWSTNQESSLFSRYRLYLDPRDKIYGILGLLETHPCGIIITDYTCTTKVLYTNTALAQIGTTKLLDILSLIYDDKCFVCSRFDAVVDFSKHAALTIRERNIKFYNASAGSTVGFHCDVRGRTRLNDMLIPKIALIVDVNDLVSKLRACSDVAGVEINSKYAYPDKRAAFWHKICGCLIRAGTSDQ